MGETQPVDTSFCDYITHEMGNPLNGMLMSIDAIERYFEANPCAIDEIGELPGLLKKEIKRLILLLSELRCSRVLAEVNLQPTSLAAEVREDLALQSGYYQQRRIRINQHAPLNLPRIMADRDKLRQILLNLCKNAVEAMPDGGTLTLRSYATEGWVCLDVADTGEGIPEGMRVFEPSVTNKAHSSGLGLAIVCEIVKQHRGTVSYTSQLGKGTTFHLKFPIQSGLSLERPVGSAPGRGGVREITQLDPSADERRRWRQHRWGIAQAVRS
jgi:signal transduction histidine kinase